MVDVVDNDIPVSKTEKVNQNPVPLQRIESPRVSSAIEANTTSQSSVALAAIKNLMEQSSPSHLGKIEGATKTIRFLEREGLKWRDGIQVLQYPEDAQNNKQAEINNFALQKDDKGHIVERRSLHIKSDGTAELVMMKKESGKWASRKTLAEANDISDAVDAMKILHLLEQNQPDNPQDGNTNNQGGGEVIPAAPPSQRHEGTAPPLPPENTPPEQEENPERQYAIRLLALNLLQKLNPSEEEETIKAQLSKDDRDIFDGPAGKRKYDEPLLRGYKTAFKIAKYYEQNADVVPHEVRILGKEEVEGPFNNKVLVYVEESFLDYDNARSVEDLARIVNRPRNDEFTFAGGEDQYRPDVLLKSISDIAIEEKEGLRKFLGRGKKNRVRKDAFTINGCQSVIVCGEIQPAIPRVDINCLGSFTVLPDSSLSPAPPEGKVHLTVSAGENINIPLGSALAASEIKAHTVNYDGELQNPHPNIKPVEIKCENFDDSHETPLNPQQFHINDRKYVERQTKLAEVTQGTRLGTEMELHAMDRNEQVCDFALEFLCQLNRKFSNAEKMGVALELFGRGADGTRDSNIFAGTFEENLTQWTVDQAKKQKLSQESLTRGVEVMLRLVAYYKEHPDVELPTQIVVLGNQQELQLDPKKKALIFWEEAWAENHEEVQSLHSLGKTYHISAPRTSRYHLNRPSEDGYNFAEAKAPDLYLRDISKTELSLTGCDNIFVEGKVQAHSKLNVSCSGELSVAKDASLISGSGTVITRNRKKVYRVENSSIQAGKITQRGDLSAGRIECSTFTHESGAIMIPPFPSPKSGERVQLVCENYTGDRPDPNIVNLITSPSE